MAKKKKPRGWVFTKEGTQKEIGFAEPSECVDFQDAVRQFNKESAAHFDVYFRDSKGVLRPCGAISKPEDFDPRGWVFTREGAEEEIGFAEASEYEDADAAMIGFSRECAEHFDVYFRDSYGELHSTAAEDLADDFV